MIVHAQTHLIGLHAHTMPVINYTHTHTHMQEGSTSLKDLMFDRDMAYACTFGRVHQVRITISDSGIVCVCVTSF